MFFAGAVGLNGLRFGGDGCGGIFGVDGVWTDGIGDGVVKCFEVGFTRGDGADVAFPDAYHTPAEDFQFGFVADVAAMQRLRCSGVIVSAINNQQFSIASMNGRSTGSQERSG